MRVHSVPQRRVPSTLSLDNAIESPMMDTSVPAVFPPAVRRFPFNGINPGEEYEFERHSDASAGMFGQRAPVGGGVHVPTISERLGGYDRRNNYDDNGIEVPLTNGELALIGNRLCREDSGLSINDPQGVTGERRAGRFARIKKICSFGTLSNVDSETSGGTSRIQYWMLIITPVVSSFSLALVIAAVVGPQWLLTEEKIPVAAHHNSTHHGGTVPSTTVSFPNQQLNIQHPHLIPASKDDGVFLTKYTRSSLWMLCSKYTGGTAPGQQTQQQQQQPAGGADFQCASIDYFPSEGYSPDPNDSSNAIPYTVKHSSPFFLASNGVLIVSYGLFLVAMCSTKHKICYFVSGVLFIISGLLMLIGLIMYISILKAEIGSKLRPRSSLQAPQFTFRYGQSFLLYVFGFIITELSGILNVLIYSNVQQEEYEEHLYRRHHAHQQDSSTYQNLSEGIHYNLHYHRRDWGPPGSEQKVQQSGQEAGLPIFSVDYRYPYDGLESCTTSPRYYFERQREDNDDAACRVHAARSLGRTAGVTKSLTDLLYTEPERPEASPGERSNGDGQRASESVRSPGATFDAPQWTPGGKLTRSVSTYTDLLPVMVEDEPRGRNVRKRSPSQPDGESHTKGGNICGISRQYLSRELSKEKLFNEFCKKVGPRPKPKNIYYIDSTEGRHEEDSFRSVFVVDPSSNCSRGRTHTRRRNSMSESSRRRTQDHHLPCIPGGYRQRIRSDNSLDVAADAGEGPYGRRRDPIGRARSVDYRQTLPRNFQQRHLAASEPEDETGGFGERLALQRKRVSASGLLMDPVRLNASHGDLTSDGTTPSGVNGWHRGAARHHHPQHHHAAKPATMHCPKYLDPPTYSPTLGGSAPHRYHHHPLQQLHQLGQGPPSAPHVHWSIGDLTAQQHFRRPTILSPQVFSPISKPTTPATIRVVQPQHHRSQPRHDTAQQEPADHAAAHRHPSLPSPVFDLDRIEQERRKSHSQLFLSGAASNSSSVAQYDFVNGTAV